MHPCVTAFRLSLLFPILLSAADFQVRDYGAKGDGTTVDTVTIQKAIEAAAKSGGTVVFKPGTYLTGAIFLKSGTHLQIDAGVELRGVQDLAGYPIMPTRVAGIEMSWPAALAASTSVPSFSRASSISWTELGVPAKRQRSCATKPALSKRAATLRVSSIRLYR